MATTSKDTHKPDLTKFYRYKLPPLHPGEFEFELRLMRPKLKPLPIGHLVDALNWVDEQSALTGSITAHRPDAADPTSFPITRGHLVNCRVHWGRSKFDLWTMRCGQIDEQLDVNTITVPLQDDMALLDVGKDDWLYRKTKRKPNGYWPDEITRDICRRVGIKPGAMPRGSAQQSFAKRKVTALDALRALWKNEKDSSGLSYIIRLRNGRLQIVTLQRNPVIYTLYEEIQTALIHLKAGDKVPTTILTGRGHIGKGKDAKKISYTHFDRRVVNQLGRVKDTKDYGQVASHGELRDKVKRDLADGLRLNDTIEIQHQGIPFVWRGDGVRIYLPKEGYVKDHAFVYCTRVDQTVQAGTFTSGFTFNETDPFLAAQTKAEKAKAAREKKAKQRNRTKVAQATKNPRKPY